MSLKLFAMQYKFQTAVAIALAAIVNRLPRSLIPKHDRSAAIFAFGNDAFEIAILQRMVLDMHGQPLHGWIERGTFRNSRAL